MNIFRGYLPSIGKKPTEKIIGGTYLENPPEKGDYVGVLKENIIQVDFDKEEDAKIALDIVNEYKLRCNILKTTRGIHLYFIDDGKTKKQSVDIFNTIGLKCDIGLGSTNSRVVPLRITKNVESIKMLNGEEIKEIKEITYDREWLQIYDELEVIPPYFKPLSHRDYELKESSTRNQRLFTYILVLQTFGYSKSEIRKIIKVANKYVIYEPLTDSEIDIITRDDAFSEELFFTDKGAFLHDRFGNYMLSNANIMNIEGQLCIYTDDNLYSNNPDDFERVMLNKIPQLKDTQRKEVYKYIMLKCTKKGEYSNPKYLGLKDSILDIETMQEFPYSPSFIINNKIDYKYNKDAYHELMDKTIDKVCCNDKNMRMLLEEMIGYALYRENSMQMCFILTGEGSNGKSTILDVIKKLLGRQNYTSLSMRDLEDNFKPAELYGKLANIGDDIDDKYLEDSSIFKKVVTGESFITNKKYGQPFELESYATQIFCANNLPPVKDKSDGFSRRINILPFNATFTKYDEDYDPFIKSKLLTDEAMEYLLKIAIEGLRRLLFNKMFTKCERGEKEKVEYIKSNNNVLEWLEDNPKIENEAVNDVYMAYKVWCVNNGCNSVKKANLSKEIKKYRGLVSKPQYSDGKTIRVYRKEKEN